jgi:hypothetical protein
MVQHPEIRRTTLPRRIPTPRPSRSPVSDAKIHRIPVRAEERGLHALHRAASRDISTAQDHPRPTD